jgi:predicted HTH domain antitoxin
MEAEVRLMAALKMYELGKLSSGKAAALAGMGRLEFFDACARYEVSVFSADGDLASELTSDLAAVEHAGRKQ